MCSRRQSNKIDRYSTAQYIVVVFQSTTSSVFFSFCRDDDVRLPNKTNDVHRGPFFVRRLVRILAAGMHFVGKPFTTMGPSFVILYVRFLAAVMLFGGKQPPNVLLLFEQKEQ